LKEEEVMDYKHAVFVGRFQPFHLGHLEVIRQGLRIAENVIVIVGSANAAPSPKNPFTFEQRRGMILESFGGSALDSIKVVGVRDYYYNMDAWLMDVQGKVNQYASEGDSIALLGQFKDASSYYLKLFPQWEHEPVETTMMDATLVRKHLFSGVTDSRDWEGKIPAAQRFELVGHIEKLLPPSTKDFLAGYVHTKEYADQCREYKYVEEYKAQWKDAPFPPMFVTTDACVTTSGHVLVVERKTNPGKGLYALPGGFLKPSELVQDGMIRELREETGIKVDKLILASSIVDSRVFDHPDRSLRGRTISHGYHIKLKDGSLPDVKGNDDAAAAIWMPLWDVIQNENKFFEDHAHIINYFVGAQGER
jgi:bifunctional NMN adenylyltransferase/nudix hydrolase